MRASGPAGTDMATTKTFPDDDERFQTSVPRLRQGELISKTLFAVDGDEINLLLRINPRRDFVRQRFATCDFHGGRIGETDGG